MHAVYKFKHLRPGEEDEKREERERGRRVGEEGARALREGVKSIKVRSIKGRCKAH
jgi:hypothetical protein